MVAGVDGADYTVREMLIEMRGTVNRTAEDVTAMRHDQAALATRVQKLENEGAFQRGQKTGFEKSARVMYALASVCGIGGIAAAVKVVFPLLGAH
jgi:hypothetical protein